MAELTLKEWLKTTTQTEAAKILDVTQGAVSIMAASDRDIRIITDMDGHVLRTYEIKPLGKRKRQRALFSA